MWNCSASCSPEATLRHGRRLFRPRALSLAHVREVTLPGSGRDDDQRHQRDDEDGVIRCKDEPFLPLFPGASVGWKAKHFAGPAFPGKSAPPAGSGLGMLVAPQA